MIVIIMYTCRKYKTSELIIIIILNRKNQKYSELIFAILESFKFVSFKKVSKLEENQVRAPPSPHLYLLLRISLFVNLYIQIIF